MSSCSISFVAIAALFIIQLSLPALSLSSSREPRQESNCHLRELDLCLASIAVLTQALNNRPVTNNEISRQCKVLSETDSCLSTFTNRCMTPRQAHLIGFFADGALNTIKEFCDPSSSLHASYLKHGNCINRQEKGRRVCMRDFQASLERAVDLEWQDRLKLACCSFNRLDTCMADVIVPNCGVEAHQLSKTIFRASFSRLPSVTCSRYDPHSRVCKALFPPPGTIPKGSKSRSVLSKLFSTFTSD